MGNVTRLDGLRPAAPLGKPVAPATARSVAARPDAFIQAGRGLRSIDSTTGRAAPITSLLARVALPSLPVANDVSPAAAVLLTRVSTSRVPVATAEGYSPERAADVATIARLAAA